MRKSTRGDRVGGEGTWPDLFSLRVFGQAEYEESSPPMALSSFSFLLASANAGVIAVGKARQPLRPLPQPKTPTYFFSQSSRSPSLILDPFANKKTTKSQLNATTKPRHRRV